MTSPLFDNLTELETESFFSACSKGEIFLQKDEYLVKAKEPVEFFYFLKTGCLEVVRDDYWGNRNVISRVEEGGVFGAAYLFASRPCYEVSVVAKKDSVAVKIDGSLSGLDAALYLKITSNIVKLLANKDISLLSTNEHLSQRTTRKKILSYLNAVGGGKNVVSVPFNRQEMADYLAVDRSALSRELSLLQKEGILNYNKNVFVLKKK